MDGKSSDLMHCNLFNVTKVCRMGFITSMCQLILCCGGL